MKVAILGSRSGWHEVRLGRALRERGVEPVVAPITGLAAAVAATCLPCLEDTRSPPAASVSTTAAR